MFKLFFMQPIFPMENEDQVVQQPLITSHIFFVASVYNL